MLRGKKADRVGLNNLTWSDTMAAWLEVDRNRFERKDAAIVGVNLGDMRCTNPSLLF